MSTIAEPKPTAATLADLYKVEGKAELVKGEIRLMSPTGFLPGNAAGAIYASLRAHARRTRSGRALLDNVGYAVDLPHRKSFSPDASYFTGAASGMRFLNGAPIFAVEVRSENDYGPQAEREMAQKRTDYFAAGTVVVWDVDLQSADVVRRYRAEAPDSPELFRRGEIADAEPATPGWTLPVDELFDED